MKNILLTFLIFCFNLIIISCAKKDGSSDTTISPGVKQIWTSKNNYGTGVTLESSENLFASEQTKIGLDRNTNLGSDGIFLVKYNTSGTKLWTEQLGVSDNDSGISLTVDSYDNIYVTEYTKRKLDGNINSGNYDIFLIKYNSSGIKLWTKKLGSSSANHGMGMTVDSFDNIYVTGLSNKFLDVNNNEGDEEFVLMKYNSFGTNQWTKQLRLSASDIALDLTVDSSDNINVIGFTNSSFDENFEHLDGDILLVKYNFDGVLQ